MNRHLFISIILLCLSACALADDDLPAVEMKADRTMIYPQRMELTGEETLMDVLLMVPDLMIANYEDVIAGYNLRIDNGPVNGDTRLVLSQMKAKDIAKIQVCTNTGVAKGTIGKGRVLDINMVMPDAMSGFVEGQGNFGKNAEGNGTVNALYGSKHTDLYANASYRYQEGNKEYLTLHMTNRFDDKNRLLTYFTQQYLELPSNTTRKVMGRARYFHTFNEQGTELLVLGSYQYATDPVYANQLPMWVLELNTPLPVKGLSLMGGVEGDYLMTRQKGTDKSWFVFNHDIYLQLTYALPQWRFTVGHRVMFYNYRLTDTTGVQKRFDVRNNTNACIIYLPTNRHQIQLGYYRKYYNPAYLVSLAEMDTLLFERDINQIKLAYAYSTQKLTIQPEASFYIVEGKDYFGEIGASAYWKTKWITLTGGANLHVAKNKVYASVRCAPTAYLPRQWQIGLQLVYYTPQSPVRELYGTPVYGSLAVNKQIGRFLNLGVEWHDMFDSFCTAAKLNRHAANIKVQFRF